MSNTDPDSGKKTTPFYSRCFYTLTKTAYD